MRLVFIEGISGVGKTTLTQKLCDKLNNMGHSVKCYLECKCYLEWDCKNPIDFYCTAYFKQHEYEKLLAEFPQYSDDIANNAIITGDIRLVRYYNGETALFPEPLLGVLRKHELCWKPSNPVALPEFTHVYKLVWEAFAKEGKFKSDFLLFDGSLLHHPINDVMHNYNASPDQIIHHVNTLVKSVKQLHPQVIYLSSNNVAERLRKAWISRNQTPGSEAQIQFWQDRKQMDMAVIQQLSIPYDIYDISNENWDAEIDTMVMSILKNDNTK